MVVVLNFNEKSNNDRIEEDRRRDGKTTSKWTRMGFEDTWWVTEDRDRC